MIQQIEKTFGAVEWENQEQEEVLPAPFYSVEIVNEREIEQAHVTLAWNSHSVLDEDIYATVLLQTMLGGSMSSRLFQTIREEKGLAYSIYCYHTSYIDGGVFAIYGGTSTDQVNELLAAIDEIVKDICTTGFTSQELDNALAQIESNLILSLESSTTWMNRLARNEILYGEQHSVESYLEKYKAVTLEDILRVAQLFQNPKSCSILKPYAS